MRYNRLCTLLIFALGLFACNEDELESRAYPSLDTKPVSNIDGNGATVNAELLSIGSNGVSDHGFVYNDNEIPTIERADRISLGSTSSTGPFSALANRNMVKDRKYQVRAYAISAGSDIIVYGQVTEFISLGGAQPEIIDFSPKQGVAGDIITITGTGFSNVARDNQIKFGSVFSETLEASENTLVCTVPVFTAPGQNEISVTVAQQTAVAVEKFQMNE